MEIDGRISFQRLCGTFRRNRFSKQPPLDTAICQGETARITTDEKQFSLNRPGSVQKRQFRSFAAGGGRSDDNNPYYFHEIETLIEVWLTPREAVWTGLTGDDQSLEL